MTDRKDVFSFDRPTSSPGFLLWRVTNLWQRRLNALLKGFNLTHAQFVVLASTHWLTLESPSVTQISIARHAGIDAMLVSNLLTTLTEKQLLGRVRAKSDPRANVISVTKLGLTFLQRAVKAVEAFDKQFFGVLGRDQKSFHHQLLTLVNIKL
jgi:DNA-binding MarR family transcriptional regulator